MVEDSSVRIALQRDEQNREEDMRTSLREGLKQVSSIVAIVARCVGHRKDGIQGYKPNFCFSVTIISI